MNAGVLIEVARLAEDTFCLEKFSETILISCAKFIKKNPQEVLEIFGREEVGEDSMLLHRLMAKASKMNISCDDASIQSASNVDSVKIVKKSIGMKNGICPMCERVMVIALLQKHAACCQGIVEKGCCRSYLVILCDYSS
jgi:hypothetical protein